jgi:hypothetical protein
MRIFAVSNNERPHSLTKMQKDCYELYKRLENFIADCTVEEAKESRDAFVKVQTMIYQRMRETKK